MKAFAINSKDLWAPGDNPTGRIDVPYGRLIHAANSGDCSEALSILKAAAKRGSLANTGQSGFESRLKDLHSVQERVNLVYTHLYLKNPSATLTKFITEAVKQSFEEEKEKAQKALEAAQDKIEQLNKALQQPTT